MQLNDRIASFAPVVVTAVLVLGACLANHRPEPRPRATAVWTITDQGRVPPAPAPKQDVCPPGCDCGCSETGVCTCASRAAEVRQIAMLEAARTFKQTLRARQVARLRQPVVNVAPAVGVPSPIFYAPVRRSRGGSC